MTIFADTSTPRHHAGHACAVSPVARVYPTRMGFDSARGLSAMLLAAMVSALVVVADQMIETWVDGHLLAMWVVLWAVGFAAAALLSGAACRWAARAVAAGDAWSARLAKARADARVGD